MLGNATQRTYAPGATLVAEGERSVNLFFILSGHARVSTAHEGQRAILGPGDFFGELGLIEMHPRTATVVAEDEITCVLLPAWEFRDVLAEHPRDGRARCSTRLVARLHGMAPHEHPADHASG